MVSGADACVSFTEAPFATWVMGMLWGIGVGGRGLGPDNSLDRRITRRQVCYERNNRPGQDGAGGDLPAGPHLLNIDMPRLMR